MPEGTWEFGTNPQLTKMAIEGLAELLTPRASKMAQQRAELLKELAQKKAWEWPKEVQQEFFKDIQYQPSLFGKSEPLFPQIKMKTPMGRMEQAPMTMSRPPLQLPSQEDVGTATKFLMNSGYDEKTAKTGAIQWLTGLKPGTDEAEKFEDFKQRETFKASLKPPGAWHPTTKEEALGFEEERIGLRPPIETSEEKMKGFKERETFKEGLRAKRPVKEPTPPAIPVAATKQLRLALLRLYLNDPTVWKDEAAQEEARKATEQVDLLTGRGGTLEDVSKFLNSDQRRTFEEIVIGAEKHVRTLGVSSAINQALHDLRAQRPGAFQRQGGMQPPERVKREGTSLRYRVPKKGVITISPQEKVKFLKLYPNAEEVR